MRPLLLALVALGLAIAALPAPAAADIVLGVGYCDAYSCVCHTVAIPAPDPVHLHMPCGV